MDKYVCGIGNCTGCGACVLQCPKNAISITDEMCSLSAVIDTQKCIECGLCQKGCHVLNPPIFNEPFLWKQGWSNDCNTRSNSSSGGAAAELAKYYVSNGGFVWGCAFHNGRFILECASNAEEIKRFAGSKYVKSDTDYSYALILKQLKENKKVLFIGLPCQVGGLLHYIPDIYKNNLTTVDLICHGTPSIELLKLYLKELDIDLTKLTDLRFRDNNSYRLYENKNKAITNTKLIDKYMHSFLKCISFTESCYKCQYGSFLRASDITIGDSWGSTLPENEQKKGLSILLASTTKGASLIQSIDMRLFDVDINLAKKSNAQLCRPSSKPPERENFFRIIQKEGSFNKAFRATYPKLGIKQSIKEILLKLHII